MSGGYELGLWSLLIVASATDLLWGKVYNWTTFGFMALAVGYRFFDGGIQSSGLALVGIAVAFVFFFPLFVIRALTAGDVKLLMAVGAWSSPGLVFQLGILSILFGAAVGLVHLIKTHGFKGGFASVKTQVQAGITNQGKGGTRMPFAPAFLCAFLFLQIAEKYRWMGIA